MAAVKRAFARAAKELGGSVRTQNAEDGLIFVKWETTAGPRRWARGSVASKPKARHSEAAIAAAGRHHAA
jgi:hypothetical protein